MGRRMTSEALAVAETIRHAVVAARDKQQAAVLAFRAFERPDPTAPRGVMIDLTSPEAQAANAALFVAGKHARAAESAVTAKCPEDEHRACPRCAG